MSGTAITALVIVGVAVACVVYDLVAYAMGGNNATVSRTLYNVSQKYPRFSILVAFLAGVFFGHVFLPQHIPAP